MTGRLAHKRAIVTGGGNGIGRATVERFRAEGAEVLAIDIDRAALEDLRASYGCEIAVADLADARSIDQCVSQTASVDILFLCAGYVATGTILDCNADEWDRSFSINVTAIYRMIRSLLPGMIARSSGSIITMASVASSVRGVPDRCAYGATKAAVIGLTKAVAADFVQQGIRANAICPGTIDTTALDSRLRAATDYDAARAAVTARQPMRRLGTASEVADLAVYLASDESRFTTGQCHVIDGGWSN
jgi:2-keto-3-deoxy-L-fuconate dehydrogenase